MLSTDVHPVRVSMSSPFIAAANAQSLLPLYQKTSNRQRRLRVTPRTVHPPTHLTERIANYKNATERSHLDTSGITESHLAMLLT